MAGRTFIDQTEDAVDDVSKWGAKMAKLVLAALSPDGRGFRQQKQSTQAQLKVYLEKFRGNDAAWEAWINERVEGIKQKLRDGGVPEDLIVQAIPYNRVAADAVAYSARMEKLLRKNDERHAEERAASRVTEAEPVLSYAEL